MTFSEMKNDNFLLLAGVSPHLITPEKIDPSAFSTASMLFVEKLSKRFMSVDKKLYPEIFTLGFDFRKSGISKLRNNNDHLANSNIIVKPKGMIFHVPPTNVETVFVYTLVYGVLSGSSNVVRISDRTGDVTKILIEIISDTLLDAEMKDVASRVSVIQCDRDSSVLQDVAFRSDLRVWWGGDQAVTSLKKFDSQPRTIDVSFPDRWSIALIDASSFNALGKEESQSLLQSLSKDIYLFDQLACSSPQAIYWSTKSEEDFRSARLKFDQLLSEAVYEMDYDLPIANFVDKAIKVASDVLSNPGEVSWHGKELVSTLIEGNVQSHVSQSGGALYHIGIKSLNELPEHLDSRVQTVVSFGVEKSELTDALVNMKIAGIDRVVSPGRALSFGPIWDGIDLISSFTRKIDLSQL